MIRRGTTPTITMELEGLPDIDIKRAVFTMGQGDIRISKEVAVEEQTIAVRLSQEETLQLAAGRDVKIQIKILDEAGGVWATRIANEGVTDILNEEVLT